MVISHCNIYQELCHIAMFLNCYVDYDVPQWLHQMATFILSYLCWVATFLNSCVAFQHSLRVIMDCYIHLWLCLVITFILVGLCHIATVLNGYDASNIHQGLYHIVMFLKCYVRWKCFSRLYTIPSIYVLHKSTQWHITTLDYI